MTEDARPYTPRELAEKRGFLFTEETAVRQITLKVQHATIKIDRDVIDTLIKKYVWDQTTNVLGDVTISKFEIAINYLNQGHDLSCAEVDVTVLP